MTLSFDQICSLRTISESNHGRVRPKANEVGTKDAPWADPEVRISRRGKYEENVVCSLVVVLTIVGGRSALFGQQTPYKQTNLVANASGVANHTDSQLFEEREIMESHLGKMRKKSRTRPRSANK